MKSSIVAAPAASPVRSVCAAPFVRRARAAPFVRSAGAALWLVAVLLAAAVPAGACTAFRLQGGGQLVVGKNYDWNLDEGLVLVNKRGVAKLFDPFGGPDGARWTSRFGSVTFNQYGRDLPLGGINERGLVVEILWLTGTEFPPPDDRPELGVTQWVQYQLDTAASVNEAIASVDRVRIRSTVEVHFFVADREGRTASVEFLDGAPVCRTGGSMSAAALTNHPYDIAAEHLRRHAGWGGRRELPRGRGSLDRFVRAAAGARAYDPRTDGNAVDHVFAVLADVAQGDATQWSIAYDLRRLRVHFRTRRERGVKIVELAGLDFNCESPVLMADVNLPASGALAPHWVAYTREANLALMTRSYRSTGFLEDVPAETIDRLARYPDYSSCAQ